MLLYSAYFRSHKGSFGLWFFRYCEGCWKEGYLMLSSFFDMVCWMEDEDGEVMGWMGFPV